MDLREVICSEQIHCLSCPISIAITGKDCHKLSDEEIKEYAEEARKNGI